MRERDSQKRLKESIESSSFLYCIKENDFLYNLVLNFTVWAFVFYELLKHFTHSLIGKTWNAALKSRR